MNKEQFLAALRARISGLPKADLERTLQYYREMIEDRMEEGMTEQAAVADVGDPAELAELILQKPVKDAAPRRKRMSRGKRIFLSILAGCLGLTGAILVGNGAMRGVAMFTGGVRNAKSYTFKETVSTILIDCADEDVSFFTSTDGSTKVICTVDSTHKYQVGVEDGVLHVSREKQGGLFQFSFLSGNSRVQVFLPERSYDSLSVETSSGEVNIPEDFRFQTVVAKSASGEIELLSGVSGEVNVQSSSGAVTVANASPWSMFLSSTSGSVRLSDATPGDVTLRSTSGSVKAEDVRCRSFTTNCTSGSQHFEDLIVEGKLECRGVSGSVELDDCDADSLDIETTSGAVRGKLLTAKVYDLRSTSGSVHAPESVSGAGRCTVRSTSGSIKFE